MTVSDGDVINYRLIFFYKKPILFHFFNKNYVEYEKERLKGY